MQTSLAGNTAGCKLIRYALLLALVLSTSISRGEPPSMTKELNSIVAGAFEFPISGVFEVSQEDGAAVFRAPDSERVVRVAFFRNRTAAQSTEQIEKNRARVQGNWEKFSSEEKTKIVRPFKRWDLSPSLVVFGMASQYKQSGKPRYYVQFAVTDGPQLALVVVEGEGQAEKAATELELQVLKVKPVVTSSEPPQKDEQSAARP